MSEVVVLDACVLVPYNLSSLLLTVAEAGLFEPRWSGRILDETERTLILKLGKPADSVARRLKAMQDAFPEASVHGFEWMEPGLTCDPKDRHVLAAPIAANATTIVTANLKDFPDDSLGPHDIVALHPERFLLGLLADDSAACAAAIERDAARKTRPTMSAGGLLAGITDIAPTFANAMYQAIRDGTPPTNDFPAYVAASIEESPLADWGKGHDSTNPLHVAFAWWTALMNREEYRDILHSLTHSPSAFGDYEWAAELLDHRSIASKVYFAVDAPEHVAFVRFVPEVAQSSQVFAAYTLPDVAFMTLCRYPDRSWRVWGLGKTMISARRALSGMRD